MRVFELVIPALCDHRAKTTQSPQDHEVFAIFHLLHCNNCRGLLGAGRELLLQHAEQESIQRLRLWLFFHISQLII